MGTEMLRRLPPAVIKTGLRLVASFALASLLGSPVQAEESGVSVTILPGSLTASLVPENGEIALKVIDARGSGAGWRIVIASNCPIEPLGPPRVIAGSAIDPDYGPKYSGGNFTAGPGYGMGTYEQVLAASPDCSFAVTTQFGP